MTGLKVPGFAYCHLAPDTKLVKVWISDSAIIHGSIWYKVHFADTKTDWLRADKILSLASVKTSV